MAQDELDHLLEAFAADRLTPEERRQLHAAAMEDKRLLYALADEQALKEVLNDPVLREHLLSELHSPGGRWRNATQRWRQPWMWITLGSVLSLVIAIFIGTKLYYEDRVPEQPLIAERDDSRPTSPREETPAPKSDRVTPEFDNDATPPPVVLNKPNADRLSPPRIPAPFAEPMVEERVVDDEIGGPHATPRKQNPEAPSRKKSDSLARSKTKPPGSPAPKPNTPTPPPAEPTTPAQQQAAAAPSSRPRTTAHMSSARAIFYGTPAHVASAGNPDSYDSRETKEREAEHEPLTPTAPQAPLALRYSLVIADPDGKDHEVKAETPVSLSDRPRLAVVTNQDGYLVVTDVPSTSDMAITLPAAPKSVHGRSTVVFPLAGLITDAAADPILRLRLTFTARPEVYKHLLTQTPEPPLTERVEPTLGGSAEHAVYAAARSQNPVLVIDVTITRRS